MSAQIAALGRLGADPVQRQSQTRKFWATASVVVLRLAEQARAAR
jgi:hypothetical protein